MLQEYTFAFHLEQDPKVTCNLMLKALKMMHSVSWARPNHSVTPILKMENTDNGIGKVFHVGKKSFRDPFDIPTVRSHINLSLKIIYSPHHMHKSRPLGLKESLMPIIDTIAFDLSRFWLLFGCFYPLFQLLVFFLRN